MQHNLTVAIESYRTEICKKDQFLLCQVVYLWQNGRLKKNIDFFSKFQVPLDLFATVTHNGFKYNSTNEMCAQPLDLFMERHSCIYFGYLLSFSIIISHWGKTQNNRKWKYRNWPCLHCLKVYMSYDNEKKSTRSNYC